MCHLAFWKSWLLGSRLAPEVVAARQAMLDRCLVSIVQGPAPFNQAAPLLAFLAAPESHWQASGQASGQAGSVPAGGQRAGRQAEKGLVHRAATLQRPRPETLAHSMTRSSLCHPTVMQFSFHAVNIAVEGGIFHVGICASSFGVRHLWLHG